jgi:hypothetical protein
MPRRWRRVALPTAHLGGYYAAFIRDPEDNKIEAATFTQQSA